MSKSTDAAILAGINDDSFQKAFQRGSNARAYEALRAKDPKAAISVSGDGNISVNPEDPLSAYLRGAQIQNLQEERHDKKIQGVADRVEKSGILQSGPALQQTEKSFQGKSVGPIMNVLPEWAQSIAANVKSRAGEVLNKPEWQGAGEEWQDLQRLRNIDIRQFAGSAQTQAEAARKLIEQGVSAGGSPDQVKRGMAMMRAAMESEAGNIQAGANPAAVREYSKRQGVTDLKGLLGKAPAPLQTTPPPPGAAPPAAGMSAGAKPPMDPAARQKRIQELRAKQGGI